MERVILIGHRPFVPQAVAVDRTVELIAKTAWHRQHLLDQIAVGQDRSNRHQARVEPGLMIVHAEIAHQQGGGGGAEQIGFDVGSLSIAPACRAAGQVVGLGQFDNAECLVEALAISPGAERSQNSRVAPTIAALRIMAVIVGQLQQDPLYFRGIAVVAGMQPGPAELAGGSIGLVVLPSAIGCQRPLVPIHTLALGTRVLILAEGMQRTSVRWTGVIESPIAGAVGHHNRLLNQLVGRPHGLGFCGGEIGQCFSFGPFGRCGGQSRRRQKRERIVRRCDAGQQNPNDCETHEDPPRRSPYSRRGTRKAGVTDTRTLPSSGINSRLQRRTAKVAVSREKCCCIRLGLEPSFAIRAAGAS